ncbi:MAG: hypothetical protein WCK02_15785 [Bacteroidota bacterium]
MILILSEKGDISTNKVIEWLEYFNVCYLRINTETNIDLIYRIIIDNSEINIYIYLENDNYNLKDFSCIWNRRGDFRFTIPHVNDIRLNKTDIKNEVIKRIKQEYSSLLNFVYYEMSKLPHINDPRSYNINKLIVLSQAKDIGFNVPDTLIVKNSKFLINKNLYITKNIQDIVQFASENEAVIQYTTRVSKKDIKCAFGMSLFQNEINIKFEIRSFVFLEKIYSVAYLLNANTPKRIRDSRMTVENYVNYKLPREIEIKIFRLMRRLKVNSGSVDIIYDGSKYFFLEINPVGQFDFVSYCGNYQIEKEIALQLKKY